MSSVVVDKESEEEKDLLTRAGPGATLPILELADGTLLCSSFAIASYLAEVGCPHLLGTTPVEQAQVDQWSSFITTELAPILTTLSYMTFGQIPCE
jgi:glutathione S-transferase